MYNMWRQTPLTTPIGSLSSAGALTRTCVAVNARPYKDYFAVVLPPRLRRMRNRLEFYQGCLSGQDAYGGAARYSS